MDKNKFQKLRDASDTLCEFCGSVNCETCPVTHLINDAETEEENDFKEGNKMTRYYLCGIGYDENNRVTDNEWTFGVFADYAEAYEHFVKLQCRNAASFFKDTNSNVYNVYQLLIQLEECEENEDGVECIDVRNEFWVTNPNYNGADVYVCYEANIHECAREAGPVNNIEVFGTPEFAAQWALKRIKDAIAEAFVPEEVGFSKESIIEKINGGFFSIEMYYGYQKNYDREFDICVEKKKIQGGNHNV